jgi:hypothetical protein
MTPMFDLGQVVATPDALAALDDAQVGAADYLNRHMCGDWGEVDKADARENDTSVRLGFRVLSAYILPLTDVKIWVITEADRSSTTILLPDEY